MSNTLDFKRDFYDNRTEIIAIRVTPFEKIVFKKRAKDLGLTVTNYIMWRCFCPTDQEIFNDWNG